MIPRRVLDRFRRDCRGVAVVELAMIAPLLAGMALVSFEIWQSSASTEDMRTALKVGAQYYMNGGTSDATAQSLALSSWENAPANAAVSVVRACLCGQVANSCVALCTDGAPPLEVVTLSASATRPDAVINPNLSDERVVRVR